MPDETAQCNRNARLDDQSQSTGGQCASLGTIAVVIPALNEAQNLRSLVPDLLSLGVGQVVVGDNGSTDGTGSAAAEAGAMVVRENRRGYGAACFAAMQTLGDDITVVAFLDADLADEHGRLSELVRPIMAGEADFVLSHRARHLRQPGSMTWPQRFGTWLAALLIYWGWGFKYHDLGPFRAIRRTSLERIAMRDRAFGWTVEMQIRAVEENLRIQEIEMAYARRVGRSKISGTVKGVFLAGYWIMGTCARLWLTRRQRGIGKGA